MILFKTKVSPSSHPSPPLSVWISYLPVNMRSPSLHWPQVILCQFIHPPIRMDLSFPTQRAKSKSILSPVGLISRAASVFCVHHRFMWKSIKQSQKKVTQTCTWWMRTVRSGAHCHCQQPVFRRHLPNPRGVIINVWKLIIMFIQPLEKCLHVLRHENI